MGTPAAGHPADPILQALAWASSTTLRPHR